ncbi:MAG: oxidoreductase [Alphaproteobacteria bacterium]|nr:oxidoreductase [Alphaproteobacteria bacterium]
MTQQEKNILTESTDERQPCEIWTRVMGYHRPISEFNKGKKREHKERRMFTEQPIGIAAE